MDERSTRRQLVCGEWNGRYRLALVLKLTFRITDRGDCVPADEQLPLIAEPSPYEGSEPSRIPPPSWDCDLCAFKPGTDVVVQGHAYNHERGSASVDVELRSGQLARTVRVHGDRRLGWRGDRPEFTRAQPFERMPLRFDRAYGGVDAAIETDEAEMFVERLAAANPDDGWDGASRQHYPRNPAGIGYVRRLTKGESDGMPIPNLEYPFDPITPSRLAVGEAAGWIDAPLPAAFDWYDPGWFPRIAYLGLTPPYRLARGGVREIEQGWAAPNLLETPSVLNLNVHPTIQHGASPCLIHKRIEAGERFRLSNLFPRAATREIRLSERSPKVTIHPTASRSLECRSCLGTVVIRPDDDRLVEVWSARTEVTRPYGPDELAEMRCTVRWS